MPNELGGLLLLVIFAGACGDSRGSALSGDPNGTVVSAPSAQAGSPGVTSPAPQPSAAAPTVPLPAASGGEDAEDEESDEDEASDEDDD